MNKPAVSAILACSLALGGCSVQRQLSEGVNPGFVPQSEGGRGIGAQLDLQVAALMPHEGALAYLQEINGLGTGAVEERYLCRNLDPQGITHKTFLPRQFGVLNMLTYDTHTAFSDLSLEATLFSKDGLIEVAFQKKHDKNALPCVIWQTQLPPGALEADDEQRAIINKIATASRSLGVEVVDLLQ